MNYLYKNMSKIKHIWARQILDSRGIPTIEAACQLDSGHVGVASVPSGTSTGSHEALELRDNDPEKYKGLGVLLAVENVNNIMGPSLIGTDPVFQSQIDQKLIDLDGTENKTKYGANAILAISEAVCKTAAVANSLPLYKWINGLALKSGIKAALKIPTPLLNMINGGKHGAGNLDFQEFLIVPAVSKKYTDGLRMAVEIYLTIGENLSRRGAIHSIGHEGGYAPNLFTNADAFEVLVESIKETAYSIGRDVFLGLDVAANSFYRNGEYTIRDKSASLDDNGFLEFYKMLYSQYHLAILEDPFFEDAWGSWQKITAQLGNQSIIVGDDLLATNPKRLQKAIVEKACNGVIVKPNQIGTVSETINFVKETKTLDWKTIVSHRSGETNDSFIADFAVGSGVDYVKFGAPARGERVAKYNRLSSIENEI